MGAGRTLGVASIAALLLAGCLQVVPDVVQPTGTGSAVAGIPTGTSTGGASNTSGGSPTAGGNAAGSTTGGTGGCTYPVAAPGANQFPDAMLGVGWVNLNGVPDANSSATAEPSALLQLHCSGARYALIDLSTAWAAHSQSLGKELPTDTTAWLAQGGLILTVLEQGSPGRPATTMDLTTWATEYGTNFSLVNDPAQSLASTLGVQVWPALYVVRLSDMEIVNSVVGGSDAFVGDYAVLLAETFDAGT